MDAIRVRTIQTSCAPDTFPCPTCGTPGRRKDTHTRLVRDIAYGHIRFVELTVGEYRAACDCRKTSRSHIDGIEPRAEYTNRVRDAVLDRLLDDGLSVNRLQQSMRRDFLLDLSAGFLSDGLDGKVRQTDLPAYRRWTPAHFSGTLCVDELHLGHRVLLPATDPLGDFPVAFALVSTNDQDHTRRFLSNLKRHGFSPRAVVTDGSNLYPAVLAELWPEARHQSCVFHVLKDIDAHVFDALRRLRRRHAATGGRQRRRGRPRENRRRAGRGPTRREQAHYVWKNRHLVTTRPENLDGRQRRRLSRVFESLPALRRRRAFVLQVYRLFDPEQSPHQASCRRAALVRDAGYQADPDLAKALAMLTADKFAKMAAYLHRPAGERVRTNNHVERTNRRLRHFEKVRYKWRRRRTIVRFVVLALERWHRRRIAQKQSVDARHQKPHALLPRKQAA